MNKEIDKEKLIKRLKRDNAILLIYVLISLIIMIYNMVA
jgi:hypothetical protein